MITKQVSPKEVSDTKQVFKNLRSVWFKNREKTGHLPLSLVKQGGLNPDYGCGKTCVCVCMCVCIVCHQCVLDFVEKQEG